MYEEIDALQERGEYYVIDYIPYDTDDPRFLKLEEYFERTYLPSFAEKIIRIILKTIYRFPCAVYVTRPLQDGSTPIPKADKTTGPAEHMPDDAEPASEATIPTAIPYDTDLGGHPPAELAATMRRIILADGLSSMQVLGSVSSSPAAPRFLVSLDGGFSVTIYGIEDQPEVIGLLQQLTTQEGLFLKHRPKD